MQRETKIIYNLDFKNQLALLSLETHKNSNFKSQLSKQIQKTVERKINKNSFKL